MAKKRASLSPEGTEQPKKQREIVPSKVFEKVDKKVMEGVGTGQSTIPCPICDICESEFDGGFIFCHEGVPYVMGDHPATGGPWCPGWVNGQWVWVNVG